MTSASSSSHPKPNNRHHIANRRSEVWSYLCQGMTRQDIATALKVDASTISRDIEYLTLKSQQYIDNMANQLHVGRNQLSYRSFEFPNPKPKTPQIGEIVVHATRIFSLD